MSQQVDAAPDVTAPEVTIRPREAIATAVFAVALPIAAFAEAAFLDTAPTGLAAVLLIGAAATLSGAYVYGRIESMSREMNEAAAAARRLPKIGSKIERPTGGPWMSKSNPGRNLAIALTTAAFQIEMRIDALETRTARDVETGLLNRDGLSIEIAAEINRARRSNQPVTLGLVDIDKFDRYVSERGSIAAGAAVNIAARIIGGRLRNYDRIARRDASCFLLLLPGASAQTSMEILRRVRDDIEQALGLPDGVSAGMATLETSDTGPEPILSRADERLKQLRLSGGARTVEAA
jgi:diguanylate cyclase (GGDEF)-like protein